MGFQSVTFNIAAERANYQCEVCGKNMRKKRSGDVALYELHSASTLHLVDGPEKYLVTDPPTGFENLRGKRLWGGLFLVSEWNLSYDAFCLCPTCHRDIHWEALIKTKCLLPGYKGRSSSPAILELVTLSKVSKRFWSSR